MIDFKEFNKDELIVAAEKLLEFNMLPSMEEHISRILNNMKFNRLTDARNNLAIKLKKKLEERKTRQRGIDISKLYKAFDTADKQREVQLEKLLELKMISQEDFNNLSTKGK
jgi:hypothetical protein